MMNRSIQDVAKLAGTTSRTLRHYDDIGLLSPSSIGVNGYRYYDEHALIRLQRILLLRELGLGLAAIAEVIDGQRSDEDALAVHLALLEQEKRRLGRQIASVETTITRIKEGRQLMAEEMFDGFDHTQYKEEVQQRWGDEAYAAGDVWWRSKSPAEKAEWQAKQEALASDWAAAADRDASPDSDEAQGLARRHRDWLADVPGTPKAETGGPSRDYFIGLGEMYVADPRFGANYGGEKGAEFVRDAMRIYAERNL